MREVNSLILDIRKVLDNEAPWFLEKRSHYDPYRLLTEACERLEQVREMIEDRDEKIAELRQDLRDMDDQLSDLENQLAKDR